MTNHEDNLRDIIIRHSRERDAASAEKIAIIKAIRAGADDKTIIRMMATCISLWTGDTGFYPIIMAAMEKTQMEKEGKEWESRF